MKKNIIIGILAILCIFFVVYAQIQTNEAVKMQAHAEALALEAEKHRQAANEASQRATESAAEANRQQRIADQALADCKGK